MAYAYTDENGKRHYKSFTAETKSKAERLAADFMDKKGGKDARPVDITIGQAIDQYIERSEILSPTSLQFYRSLRKNSFQGLMDTKLSEVDADLLQQAINKEVLRVSERTGRRISAKTVKEEWSLLAVALKAATGKSFNIRLPKRQQKVKDYPEPGPVLDAIIGTSIELPCLLAMWLSFSMSEIRGLMCSSVRDGHITISQVVVDVDGKAVVKDTAKVDTRLRKHRLPAHIMRLIEETSSYQRYIKTGEDGFLIETPRPTIVHRWQRICKEHGFNMTFHDLRHMNASIMAMLNIPEKYAMERGGWRTPHVMKSVYQHTFSKERQAVDDRIDDFFEQVIGDNATR